MVRKGISPTPSFIISAKPSDQVTKLMHERALVHYLIAETHNNGRFYQQAPALQNYAFSPLLYIGDKSQHHSTGALNVEAIGIYMRHPRYLPIKESIDILDP